MKVIKKDLHVLIADDQLHVRKTLFSRISDISKDFFVLASSSEASTAEEALALSASISSKKQNLDLVIMDICFDPDSKSPDSKDGHWAINQIAEIFPDAEMVFLSSYSTDENFEKTNHNPHVSRFLSKGELRDAELKQVCLWALLRKLHKSHDLIPEEFSIQTQSSVMSTYLRRLDQCPANSNVMMFGLTGTGKTLSARRLNANAKFELQQSNRPFVEINCGAISDEVLESELFGHVKGSFTGAIADKVGLLACAHGGDLFLDELQNASIRFQNVLMRAIESKTYRPVGSTKTHEFNARIISALNMTVSSARDSGVLKSDFIARLRDSMLSIPPLSERPEDIDLLVDIACEQYTLRRIQFTQDARNLLKSVTWIENIRGCAGLIKEAIRTTKNPFVTRQCLLDLPKFQEFTNVSSHDTSLCLSDKNFSSHVQQMVTWAAAHDVSLPQLTDSIEAHYLEALQYELGPNKISEIARRSGLSLSSVKRKLIR